MTNVVEQYIRWLPCLSDADRAWARTRHVEVVELRAAEPDRPEWFELYLAGTVAALDDVEDPAGACWAVLEDGDMDETVRAIAAMAKTSTQWAEWWPAWHPSPN